MEKIQIFLRIIIFIVRFLVLKIFISIYYVFSIWIGIWDIRISFLEIYSFLGRIGMFINVLKV